MNTALLLTDICWRARLIASKLSWVGIFALVLLCVGAWLMLEGAMLQKQYSEQQNNITKLTAQLNLVDVKPAQQTDLAEQRHDFYAKFKPLTTLNAQLLTLSDQARQVGIALPVGNYRLIENKEGQLTRYEITYAIATSYPKLRQFILAATQSNAALMLQGVTMSRETSDSKIISSEVVFYLYLKSKGHENA